MEQVIVVNPALLAASCLFMGLGLWLLLAATNNLLDRSTNTKLLYRMCSMEDIRKDQDLGVGLLSRSIESLSFVKSILLFGIFVEYIISIALVFSSMLIGALAFGIEAIPRDVSILISGVALSAYMLLWFAFLISGLWFAYWIKLGEVQSVHFTLLIIAIASQILFHVSLL